MPSHEKALRRARLSWLATASNDGEREAMEKTGFLSYRDSEGHQADFHSLRHTFLSRLGRSGASAKVMQRLARHSTVELTLGRYTHAGLFDLQSAVDKLPPLPTGLINALPEVIRATGTTAADVLPSGLPKIPARGSRTVRSGALKDAMSSTAKEEENPEKPSDSSEIQAERVRFELTMPLRTCRFSRPVQSCCKDCHNNALRLELNSSCTDSCTTSPETDQIDPELSKVISAWPKLTGHIKAAILALVGLSPVQ